MRAWLHALAVWAAGMAWLSAASLDLPDQARWAVDELVSMTISDTTSPNPQQPLQLGPILRITAPDATQVERLAFADQTAAGEVIWRVRHTFRQPGSHRLEVISSAHHSVDQLAAKTVQIEPAATITSAASGVITVAPWNHRLLATPDGQAWIPVGCNLGWNIGADDNWQRWMAAIAASGGNHIRIWLASWSGQVQAADQGWRPDAAATIDQVLELARHYGIRVTLVLDNAFDIKHGRVAIAGNPATAGERARAFLTVELDPHWRRRTAYALARWGADDALLGWELMNEIDLLATVPGGPQMPAAASMAWIDAALPWVRARDPDQRLLTNSLSRGAAALDQTWQAVQTHPGLDMVDQHIYVQPPENRTINQDDAVGLLLQHMAALPVQRRPVRISESGHQGTEELVLGHQLDSDGLVFRRQLWAGFLSGGAGSAMNWWWDTYLDPNDLWPAFRPLRNAITALNWRDPNLRPIDANPGGSLRVFGWHSQTQALLWPHVRSDTWHHLLIAGNQPHSYPGIGPRLQLGGFTPGRDFRLRLMRMLDGVTTRDQRITSDTYGVISCDLPTTPGDMALIITLDTP